MNNNKMILSQGYKYILCASSIAILFFILGCTILSNIFFLITLFIAFAFRNPNRDIYTNSQSILSPIDGTVIAIDNTNGKKKIYCKVTPCDVCTVRSPLDSNMKIKNYQHGLHLNPNSYKALLLNEQITFKFHHIKLQLISGICNTKIELTKKENCMISQGEPIAIFVEGLAIITIKENDTFELNIGDKLKAGQTKILND